jgi:tRNA-specific 2-thiouridylase
MPDKAVIAMSGGVDSSVAAALMLEQGYACSGFTLKLHPGAQDIHDAAAVALRLGIPHQVFDYTEKFERQVIRSFINIYEQGATPNPCIVCNRYIKFDLESLREQALPGQALPRQRLGFDCIATGHYARVAYDAAAGRFLLRKAADPQKDQSYVLYCLNQEQLAHARFPLGELTKQQVRAIAAEKHFANNAKAESQDICFVPDGDYGSFIESYTGKTWPPGDIIDADGKILGRHKGIIRYTIGQRRGLGVAANTPIYVSEKSVVNNTVTLGPDSGLYRKSLIAKDINIIACARLDKPLRVTVKTRYLQTEQPAVAEQIDTDTLRITFDSPQRAVTPGQAAVMYDGDIVVGGGTISAKE